MSRLRDTPWTIWMWIALVLLEIGLVALPGDPTLGPGWGLWLAFDAVIVIAIVRSNHLAWTIAAALSVVGLVGLVLILVWPWSAVEVVLIALSVAQVFALFHRRTRQWTARAPDHLVLRRRSGRLNR